MAKRTKIDPELEYMKDRATLEREVTALMKVFNERTGHAVRVNINVEMFDPRRSLLK